MDYKSTNIGVVLEDYREAALFFDHVVPVFSSLEFPKELLPRGIFSTGEIGNVIYEIEKLIPWEERWELGSAQDNPEYYEDIQSHLVKAIPKFVRNIESKNSLCVPVLPEEYSIYVPKTGFEAISVVSTNVARVNTKEVSWRQIKEFREDEKSVIALRNYRLFWYDTYRECSTDYITDHLSMKYEHFRSACRKHGFDVIYVSLTNILQSKSLLSASALSLASVIANEPELGMAALASGVAIDIGKTAISISKTQLDKDLLVKNSELAYLSRLETNLT
jgi:hypothetical protein